MQTPTTNEVLREACKMGNLENLNEYLINELNNNTDMEFHHGLRIAVENNQIGIVIELLNYLKKNVNNEKILKKSDNLIIATLNGNIKLVEILLEDGRIDPRNNKGEAILIATYKGYLEIVDLLLRDKRIYDEKLYRGALEYAMTIKKCFT